ncbi:outer membrane protein [Beijerinckia sp. L45]|uniref:outer membrane protein n=1 Tax=Beijerinckia sp. L45 TaxID=1641855 RepID=UPI00131DF8A4|nr:outer membrane beta-barrel protein [Beijerinckia sp. L45]
MNKFAFAALALILASPALAADLPGRYAPPPMDSYAPPPMFTWTGLYVGANGALAVGSFSNRGNTAFGNAFGGFGGGTVGYNYQQGSLLVGAEGDIAFGSASGSGSAFPGSNSSGQVQGIGTARVRFGYVYDRALFYITGGYAGASVRGTMNDSGAAPNLFVDQSHYLNGYAVGAGVEFAITKRISVKGEYIFTGFGSGNYFNGTRDSLNSGANINLIRAGVNYHF